ncbi:NUDIX domain-containing protein [Patescibacteria group bacterium]|nr:NUDIX domain-containing protein [Patescibacteria group bacterium]MBU4511679.1 NUDIX domain-containing protein [Patescibacteria group bacterium]
MPQEYSAGAVIFHRAGETIKYLLLRYISEATGEPGYWGFAKGHIEAGEEVKVTVVREVEEETGLRNVVFVGDILSKDEYFFRRKGPAGKTQTVHKEVIYYLVESKTDQAAIPPDSHEHCELVWLSYEKAVERATHENSKMILGKANDILVRGT